MPNGREIRTCSRCRNLKLRCNRTKPSCQRCIQANVDCSWRPSVAKPAVPKRSSASGNDSTSEALTQSNTDQSPSPASPSENPASSDLLGDTNVAKGPKAAKRRQRAHLSCIRCHRLKVRCDKELPCSRCRLSGWGRHCEYTHRVDNDADTLGTNPPAFVVTGEDPSTVVSAWHTRHRGATHWKELLPKLGLLAGDVDSPVFHMALDEINQNHIECTTDLVLPINFPFNSAAASKYNSLDKVRDLVQSHREDCQSFIDGYMALYQPVHPIIDAAQFLLLVDSYWDDPTSADPSWLANFLMILALGCFAVTRKPAPTVELCMAAEACLNKTPFMVWPSISTVRALCLMAIAKQTANGTCWSFDSCWTFLGVVVRLAVCLGLHRQPRPQDDSTKAMLEWQSGQTLWMTIVHFTIQTAAITGMPMLLSPEEIMTKHGSLLCDSGITDPWLSLMRDSYPTICHIITRVNSDIEKPSYEEILEYSGQVRQLMSSLDNFQEQKSLRITLEIFFRRILLVLHRQHALHPNAPAEYPVSYWASLECSLAILVHHRDFCENHGNLDNLDLLGRLFKLDFFSAALTACIHLLRQDAPLAAGFAIPPRQTIFDTLEACTEIWAREKHRSVCFRSVHRLLVSILLMLSDMSMEDS